MRTQRLKEKPELINNLVHGLSFADDATVNSYILTKYRLYNYLWPDDEDQTATMQTIINDWKDYTEKLYATTQYEYDPIENYNRQESITDTRTDNLQHNETVTQTPNDWKETQTQTPNHWKQTQTQTPSDWKETQTQTPENWKNVTSNGGYNSGASVPTSDTEQQGTYTTETKQAGTFETVTEQAGTFETETERTGTFETETAGSNIGTQTNVRNANIHGNIGVMSTQQMIEQERSIIIDVLDFYVSKFAPAFKICLM